MIRAGRLYPIGYLQFQGRDEGGNLSAEFENVASCPLLRGEKLSESAGQRKSAVGVYGSDTMTYRLRFRADIDRTKIIRTEAGNQLDIIGIENVDDRGRELLVTVRDRKAN